MRRADAPFCLGPGCRAKASWVREPVAPACGGLEARDMEARALPRLHHEFPHRLQRHDYFPGASPPAPFCLPSRNRPLPALALGAARGSGARLPAWHPESGEGMGLAALRPFLLPCWSEAALPLLFRSRPCCLPGCGRGLLASTLRGAILKQRPRSRLGLLGRAAHRGMGSRVAQGTRQRATLGTHGSSLPMIQSWMRMQCVCRWYLKVSFV